MNDYSSPLYDEHRYVITKLRKKREWDWITYYGKSDEVGLQRKLEMLQEDDIIPEDLDAKLWLKIVKFSREAEERKLTIEETIESNRIMSRNHDNDLSTPHYESSSWQLYKQSLIDQKWSQESIAELERTTVDILKKLRLDTRKEGPVKGLAIGHVQSGKTANMAAVMAMAADWGWNVFIVLSGVIDNLREQTETRLIRDLKHSGTLSWERLRQLSFKKSSSHKVSELLLGEESRERYLNVCLKNKTRLNDLIKWLKDDGNKLKQMRILIIDDEADQGGINTNDIKDDLKERTEINKAIVNLAEIQAEDGSKPLAMNYISYTATPYANFLNEATPKSLYPRDFIATLKPAKEYFGAKQIFGLEKSEEFRGLKIVREILKEENELIKAVHKGEKEYLPESFKNAIYWFLVATSVMRYRKYKKPISMLVHTSQKQEHHNKVAKLVEDFFHMKDKEEVISNCREVYEEEIKNFTKEDFELDFEGYPQDVKDYPPFEKIEGELKRLISEFSHISVIEETKKLQYHEGVHLCVDNCANNGITEDSKHVRLAYPDLEQANYPSPAPAFIIIGGSTLSRGLTIEGLVSTYFLRTTKQADTLLQMGRFFGYRKGYEMLPRIWMTKDTQKKFRFLATLEEEMRDDLKTYMFEGMGASEYGPKIKCSPKVSWIQVTAKNRMQGVIKTDLDFSGTSIQTTVFENVAQVHKGNIEITEEFFKLLGQAEETRNSRGLCWKDVAFDVIAEKFLLKFNFNDKNREFAQIETFCEWYKENEEKAGFTGWNVVLSGNGKLDNQATKMIWKVAGRKVGLVNRSRRGEYPHELINIGVLRTPLDLYADMSKETYDSLPVEYKPSKKEKQKNEDEAKKSVVYEIRKKAGLGKTPQLLIYRINKDSTPANVQDEKVAPQNKRHDLKAEEDLIGVSLFIPGHKSGRNLATKLTIILQNPLEASNEEVEGGE
ncbi:Z1 domain-containing protein [Peribacillus butanolivorans]|uniref:Z1 domain-containing protein n=1 Tax=Peribacillus butanolivorans TaxID=421767 RepID=UPI0037C6B09D